MSETPEQIAAREAATQSSAGTGSGDDGGDSVAGLKKALSAARGEAKAQREQHAAVASKIQALEQKQADEETKRLASQNDFKALYEKTEAEKKELITTNAKLAEERKRDFVRFKVAKEFPSLKEHYIEKLFNFDAVKVGSDGKLNGFQEAVDSFKTEYADLVGAQAAGGNDSGQGDTQTRQGGTGPNAFEKLQAQLRAEAAANNGGANGTHGLSAAMKAMAATREAIISGSKKVFGSNG
jgi:hypothetical protein